MLHLRQCVEENVQNQVGKGGQNSGSVKHAWPRLQKKKIDPNEIDRFNELPTGSILVAAVSNVVSIFKLSCFCIDMFKSKGYLTLSLNQGVNCISTKGKQYQSVLLTF